MSMPAKIKDELVHFYLREMSKWTKFKWIEFLGEEKKTAFYKAMELRILRK